MSEEKNNVPPKASEVPPKTRVDRPFEGINKSSIPDYKWTPPPPPPPPTTSEAAPAPPSAAPNEVK